MNLFIDALSARNGGGITYIQNLLTYIPKDKRLKIYISYQGELISYIKDSRVKRYVPHWPTFNPILRGFWQLIILPFILKSLKIDVLFVPGGVVFTNPPKNCKLVTMFRNMLPFDRDQIRKYPNNIFKIKIYLQKYLILRSLKMSDKIIFISNFARNFLIKTNKSFKNKSTVIYHGINEKFYKKKTTNSFLKKHKFILYVSRLEFYKNQISLIYAFKNLIDHYPNLKLFLIGPANSAYLKKIKSTLKIEKLEKKVFLLGEVDHNKLPDYYQSAILNIFCSETENCPNILLEAFASGKPVICSNADPMPEFGGNAPIYVNPKDSNEMFKKILHVLNNKNLKEKMAKKSIEQANKFLIKKSTLKTWAYLLEK